jgi:nitrogen fixation-related uncharacterized protein
MNPYYFYWVMLIMIGLWVSLSAFFWAFKHGQFSEQERARYLPLRNEVIPQRIANPSKPTSEVYALLGILCLGCLALLAVVVAAFYKAGGV